MVPKLYITRTPDGTGFPLPSYDTKYHAGLNLMAAIGQPIKIATGERIKVPVGFAIGIPQGFCGQIVSSPQMAEKEGLIVSDAPHIINPADRDPIFILLQNTTNTTHVLHRGDIVALLLITPVIQVAWNEVNNQVSTSITSEETMILDKKNDNTIEQDTSFVSFRRKIKSPRNRFGPDEKDT